MPTNSKKKQTLPKPQRVRPEERILLAYRDRDTEFGVTRATVRKLQHRLGLSSETQLIHLALARFITNALSQRGEESKTALGIEGLTKR